MTNRVVSQDQGPEKDVSGLLERAARGDSEARAALVCRYETVLLQRVRRRLGTALRDFTESTDCLQDVFVEILRLLDRRRFESESEFLGWATIVLENRLRDTARRRRHRKMEAFASTLLEGARGARSDRGPYTQAAGEEQVERLRLALDELPSDYRTVIELRDLEHHPYADIAEELGRTIDATRRLHARAIAKLSSRLAALHRVR